jgi:TolB-like protein/cytochrome c-type biogenesis protein CcmH/NrfG
MKQCPTCRRQYFDEMINFCLDDGEWLRVDGAVSEQSTVMMKDLSSAGEMGTQLFSSSQSGSKSKRSIAVLPFAHWSSEPDNEYFCDGLAEDLINSLAKIDGLKVAAYTSAFSFKGKSANVSDIGRALGVETILEGSVRRAGDRLRVTVQLVNAAEGYQIWSKRYDREMRDVFEMQDEIALAVVEELRPKLLGDERAELLHHFTANTEAFHLYLQGRFYVNKFSADMAFKAADCFRRAIEIAPDFARAYAGLADSLIMLTEMGPMTPVEAMPKAKEAALKALSLEPDLAEAHASLGMVLQDYDYDFDGAEKSFLRAIELSPNSPIPRQSYGILLTELERHDEAEIQFAKMHEVDPLSVVGNWMHSFCLFLARRYDDALKLAEKTLELDPSFGVAHLTVAFVYQMKGEFAKSAEAYAVCSEVMGLPENAAYVRERFADGWENFLRAMTGGERPITFSSYIVAVFFATLGDKDGAFAELERSFVKRESHIVMVKCDPRFDGLRGDPRFPDLLLRIGFN